VRRAELSYPASELERQLAQMRGAGDDAGAERLRERFLRRMWNLFSAPRDDTARAGCGNRAKSNFLSISIFYQSGDSQTSSHGLVPQEIVIAKVLFHFKLPWR
jgi:hypothetical protein